MGREREKKSKSSFFFFLSILSADVFGCINVYPLSSAFIFLRTSKRVSNKKAEYKIFSPLEFIIKKILFFVYFRNKSTSIFIHIFHFSHFLFSFIHFNTEYLAVVYSQTAKHIIHTHTHTIV
jgi:hypothetical protein